MKWKKKWNKNHCWSQHFRIHYSIDATLSSLIGHKLYTKSSDANFVNDNKMHNDNTESETEKSKTKNQFVSQNDFYYHQQKATNRTPSTHTLTQHLYAEFTINSFESEYGLQRIRSVPLSRWINFSWMYGHSAHGWWCATDSTHTHAALAHSYTIAFGECARVCVCVWRECTHTCGVRRCIDFLKFRLRQFE